MNKKAVGTLFWAIGIAILVVLFLVLMVTGVFPKIFQGIVEVNKCPENLGFKCVSSSECKNIGTSQDFYCLDDEGKTRKDVVCCKLSEKYAEVKQTPELHEQDTYTFDNGHKVTVNKINDDSVDLTIESTPVPIKLKFTEGWREITLQDKDGKPEKFQVKAEKANNGRVVILLQRVIENPDDGNNNGDTDQGVKTISVVQEGTAGQLTTNQIVKLPLNLITDQIPFYEGKFTVATKNLDANYCVGYVMDNDKSFVEQDNNPLRWVWECKTEYNIDFDLTQAEILNKGLKLQIVALKEGCVPPALGSCNSELLDKWETSTSFSLEPKEVPDG